MTQGLVELVLDEGKWIFASLSLALLTVGVSLRGCSKRASNERLEVLRAMNLFYGTMVGVMAFGHLLAVTVKAVHGTLEGPLVLLYLLGVVLAVPSWWLALRIGSFVQDEPRWRKRMLLLNGWLVVALLASGAHNGPLALPAVLNIAYQLHSGRLLGRAIAAVALAANLALFVGSVIFLASGQSFEDFKGL